mmetsp:Transcript_155732/g.478113  ORF Transcript_155732/g.478113 Transcript_155732/m.478113 type:complete len:236 (+) Transcript_155732:153-860(+)
MLSLFVGLRVHEALPLQLRRVLLGVCSALLKIPLVPVRIGKVGPLPRDHGLLALGLLHLCLDELDGFPLPAPEGQVLRGLRGLGPHARLAGGVVGPRAPLVVPPLLRVGRVLMASDLRVLRRGLLGVRRCRTEVRRGVAQLRHLGLELVPVCGLPLEAQAEVANLRLGLGQLAAAKVLAADGVVQVGRLLLDHAADHVLHVLEARNARTRARARARAGTQGRGRARSHSRGHEHT